MPSSSRSTFDNAGPPDLAPVYFMAKSDRLRRRGPSSFLPTEAFLGSMPPRQLIRRGAPRLVLRPIMHAFPNASRISAGLALAALRPPKDPSLSTIPIESLTVGRSVHKASGRADPAGSGRSSRPLYATERGGQSRSVERGMLAGQKAAKPGKFSDGADRTEARFRRGWTISVGPRSRTGWRQVVYGFLEL